MIARAAILGSVIAEALVAYTVAEWIASGYRKGGDDAVQGLTFVVVALIAFHLPQVAEFVALPRVAERIALALLSYVALYGAMRIEFAGDVAIWDLGWVGAFLRDAGDTAESGGHAATGAAILLVVWARSALRSVDQIEIETIPRSLTVPFMIVTFVLVFSVFTDRTAEVGRAGAAFYAVAVVTLACSQTALSGATFGEVRAGGVAAAMLGGVVAATLVTMLLFVLFFTLVGPYLGPPLGRAIETLLVWILTPPAWLLTQLFEFLFRGASPLPALDESLRAARDAGDLEQNSRQGTPLYQRIGAILLRTVGIAIVVALVAGAIAFALRMRSKSAKLRATNAAVTSAGGMGEDIRALFSSLFHRGSGKRTPEGEGIIRLYSEVLIRAAGKGKERAPGATPAEFAPQLADTLHTPVTDDITAAFQDARYGGRPPDPRALAELESRWRQVT